jgi:hypothetical protein
MGKFFASNIKESEIDNLIQQAKTLLASKSTDKQLMEELTKRIRQFKTELISKNTSPFEKEQILKQYYRFAKTLLKCVETPKQADLAIDSYLNNTYYPVAVYDYIKPNPIVMGASWLGLGLGIALLLASLPLFAVNPIIGAVMLAAAVTILLPSLFMLLAPDTPDVIKMKTEEQQLLKEASVFADDPTVTTKNDEGIHTNVNLAMSC